MTDSLTTAWDNPTWVLAVMHYPRELVLLDRIAGVVETEFIMHRRAWLEESTDAARRGKVAGNVLAALYALSASPWRIQEPSFARAIYLAGEMAKLDQLPQAPKGHTKIEECYNTMRPVAHLWAAYRLHGEFPTRPHQQVFSSAEGLHTLLRTARGVQDWALSWVPSRTHRRVQPPPLLGEQPRLVPDTFGPLYPPWKNRPGWLLETNKAYRRRARG